MSSAFHCFRTGAYFSSKVFGIAASFGDLLLLLSIGDFAPDFAASEMFLVDLFCSALEVDA
jgi:hypothetical protein